MSWLWKSDNSSPASYEKALSKLSTQITAANLSLENTRSRGRRIKALWTLYTTLAYLVALLILVLVIGPSDWEAPHLAVLVGSPALIYGVRYITTSVFNWRTGRQQAHLNGLQKQRDTKIADLKKATRYDTTQELLQKYGGVTVQNETPTKQSPLSGKGKPKKSVDLGPRTGLPPPPTANIQGRQRQQPTVSTPQSSVSIGAISSRSPTAHSATTDEPGFAPNAFPAPLPTRANYEQTHHWYDRILDVMLGEDENLAKNRLVLLCQNCRLVNGQAPPGVKTPEELGKWRCGSCGAWNGTESAGAKVVREMIQQPQMRVIDDLQQENKDDGTEATTELPPSESIAEDTGRGTGKANEDDSVVTKRVTRSSGEEPVEGL